jgi:hypothetical protein
VGQSVWDRTISLPQGFEPHTVYKTYSSVFVFACEFDILEEDYRQDVREQSASINIWT